MLSIRYSAPLETQKEKEVRKKNRDADPLDNADITNYVRRVSWSGDSQQAVRKLEFTIAHNTPGKDKVFVPLNLKLGGFIYVFYREDLMMDEIELFQGRIFYRKRASDSFTFEFACFNDLIYLAKNKIRAKVAGTVNTGINQICAEIGLPIGTLPHGLTAKVDFIADDKSSTEIILMLLNQQQAADLKVRKDNYARMHKRQGQRHQEGETN